MLSRSFASLSVVFLLSAALFSFPVHAVEGGSPTSDSPPTPDGEQYVGMLNGSSGVYLGNGYVLTVAHVGAGNFTLGGTTYDYVSGSAQSFGSADITLFRITGDPGLPALTLATSPPVRDVTSFTLIGYGGEKSYAVDTVTETNVTFTVNQYISRDFYAQPGTSSTTYTNAGQLIGGDSGGGDFIQDATGGLVLIGLNEATIEDNSGNDDGSAFIQLGSTRNSYSALIEADMTAAPEPHGWLLIVLGAGGLSTGWHFWRRLVRRPLA